MVEAESTNGIVALQLQVSRHVLHDTHLTSFDEKYFSFSNSKLKQNLERMR